MAATGENDLTKFLQCHNNLDESPLNVHSTHCCCQRFCTSAAENVTFGTIVEVLNNMTGVQTLLDQV